MKAIDCLMEFSEKEYGDFQHKITPNVPRERFIGVRVPTARKIAKTYAKDEDCSAFLADLPHKYFDEDMLHGIIISNIKDVEECIGALDIFLSYVDNWAVCDIMSPKVFKKHKDRLMEKILEWTGSKEVYRCRFGIEMLMTYFLDEDYKEEYLEIPAKVESEEYYIMMMQAWFFATALAKQWDSVIKYIEEKKLSVWVHNKTIQKACESYRITSEQKEYLKTMKIR